MVLAVDTLGYFFLSRCVIHRTYLFARQNRSRHSVFLHRNGRFRVLGTVGFAIDNAVLSLGTLLSGVSFFSLRRAHLNVLACTAE